MDEQLIFDAIITIVNYAIPIIALGAVIGGIILLIKKYYKSRK